MDSFFKNICGEELFKLAAEDDAFNKDQDTDWYQPI
jgi:hypothetical protein